MGEEAQEDENINVKRLIYLSVYWKNSKKEMNIDPNLCSSCIDLFNGGDSKRFSYATGTCKGGELRYSEFFK